MLSNFTKYIKDIPAGSKKSWSVKLLNCISFFCEFYGMNLKFFKIYWKCEIKKLGIMRPCAVLSRSVVSNSF